MQSAVQRKSFTYPTFYNNFLKIVFLAKCFILSRKAGVCGGGGGVIRSQFPVEHLPN